MEGLIFGILRYKSTNNFASRKIYRDRKLVYSSKIKGNAANNYVRYFFIRVKNR